MLLKVQGVCSCNYSNEYLKQQEETQKTKYYNPNTPVKEEIKKDFAIILDEEIKKLHFNVVI